MSFLFYKRYLFYFKSFKKYIHQKSFLSFELKSKRNKEIYGIENIKEIMDTKKLNESLNDAILYLKKESESLKMGRSNLSLLDNLKIPISKKKSALLKDLAHVSMQNNKSILLTIYDNDNTKILVSTIRSSSLGLNPVIHPLNPHQYIIPLPPLTKENQKKKLIEISKLGENTEIIIRNIRTKNMKRLKKAKQQGELTEDEIKLKEKEITKIISNANNEVKKIIESTKKSISENQ
ncbi:hypothetical protein PNEG_00435 [Pneumocystis murina B123]|uniref:Ribosome recycling factor domain-containing protein n=1 Tax=Pneumocystis murina (strain B123) TaxID=1069680 RepID=M7NVT2_PNEMU|nr:hypothetical protein PNEG_00435 [Pneumocystis murina B123]EMR11412.1 hypothetical protein PNEG_00435 [Pneumocystis murina B123]